MKRQGEADVSINWLQFYQGRDRKAMVDCIRREVGKCYGLKPSGQFAVFGIDKAKAAAQEVGFGIQVVYTPKPPSRPSHSSIIDLPTDYDDEVKVATAILRLIDENTLYPGVV